MRITSGMISSQYSNSLNQVLDQLNKAATTAYDYRSFEKPSDDPFLAEQAFQVRRHLDLNDNYSSNVQSLKDASSSAESTLNTVYGILNNVKTSILAGIDGGTSDDGRTTYANKLDSLQKAMLSDMNAAYGNRYLFSGAGAYGEAPFSLDSGGNLLYRGINVDTGINTNGASATVKYDYTNADNVTTTKSMQINFGTGVSNKLNGYTVSLTTGGSSDAIHVSNSPKTISISMHSGETKKDLQNLLQGAGGSTTFANALSSAGITGISAGDLSKITISGVEEPGVGADVISESGTASSSVAAGSSSLSYSDASNTSGTITISGVPAAYNGYSISVTTGASSNAVTVDSGANTITINLKDGASKTDLQSLLQTKVDSSITVSLDQGNAIYESKAAASAGITDHVNLDDLASETSYVDVGIGMRTDANGRVVDQSAYNAAMAGIKFLGSGVDSHSGVPNNAYTLMGKISGLLRDSGLKGDQLMDAMKPYSDQFNAAMDRFIAQKTQIGTNVNFLDSTDNFLSDVNLNLSSRDKDVEAVEPTSAITNYYQQIFCYQAALHVGTGILQASLLDYLK